MTKEGKSNRNLHKWLLYSVKTIPIIICGIYVLKTILSYFGIDSPILSYVVQFLFILFMHLASFSLRFCRWHRVFIHYIFAVLTLNIIDYHWGLPFTDRGMFLLYGIFTGMMLFLAVYFRFRK